MKFATRGVPGRIRRAWFSLSLFYYKFTFLRCIWVLDIFSWLVFLKMIQIFFHAHFIFPTFAHPPLKKTWLLQLINTYNKYPEGVTLLSCHVDTIVAPRLLDNRFTSKCSWLKYSCQFSVFAEGGFMYYPCTSWGLDSPTRKGERVTADENKGSIKHSVLFS